MVKNPSDLFDVLKAFRKTHPLKQVVKNGTQYQYFASGGGENTIFLLPGGLGNSEPFFLHILELEKDHRVIAPMTPAVATFAELAEGIDYIAETEGGIPYTVVGQSAGGILAQELVRRYPKHVKKAVLCHTTAATKDTPVDQVQKRVKGLKKGLFLLTIVPSFLLKRIFAKRIGLMATALRDEELYFWEPYLRQVSAIRTKREQIAMLKMFIDFAQNCRYSPDDLSNWPGEILIIDSDADMAIPQSERENVRKLYPQARIQTFQDYRHMAILGHRRQYLDLIREYIES